MMSERANLTTELAALMQCATIANNHRGVGLLPESLCNNDVEQKFYRRIAEIVKILGFNPGSGFWEKPK